MRRAFGLGPGEPGPRGGFRRPGRVRGAVHSGAERRVQAGGAGRLCVSRLDRRDNPGAFPDSITARLTAWLLSCRARYGRPRCPAVGAASRRAVDQREGSRLSVPAAPFQAAGITGWPRYGALGCLGLFFGARRWLGRFGGAAAVVLFCLGCGAAVCVARLHADLHRCLGSRRAPAPSCGPCWPPRSHRAAHLDRAGPVRGPGGRVFVRYTDIVVLGCAVAAVLTAWKLRAVPAAALRWWLGRSRRHGGPVR